MPHPIIPSNLQQVINQQRTKPLCFKTFRRLLLIALVSGGSLLPAAIALAGANSPAPGTIIENQATGSFTDPANGNTLNNIESNIVKVTVAEVAGITVTPSLTQPPTEAPSGVAGAGPNQGDGTTNTGDVVYFVFDITNVGNDPTQFFIPGIADISNGTLSGPIQIIAYDTDGSSVTILTTPIDVGASGITTGTATGVGGGLGLPAGSIAPGGKVTVRVPAKAATNLANGDVLTVILGDTLSAVPADRVNQPYVDGANNRDLYTQDNQNTDTVDVPATPKTEVEAAGNPFNGDTTFHRQEASATQGVGITLLLPPNVLLIKRITALNRGLANAQLFDTSYVDVGAPNDADNVVNWPGASTVATIGSGSVESYLAGISNGAASNIAVAPGDEIEYTISFLSTGGKAAVDMLICDRIPENTTFIPNSFNSSPPAAPSSAERGILISFNNSSFALTNINDSDEKFVPTNSANGVGGYYFPAGVNPATVFPVLPNGTGGINCGGPNDNGAIVVDFSSIPNATGEGSPINSYGFIRFRAAVN